MRIKQQVRGNITFQGYVVLFQEELEKLNQVDGDWYEFEDKIEEILNKLFVLD